MVETRVGSIMRRLVFVTFVSSLLVMLVFMQKGNILTGEAAFSFHQGDLFLTNSNVTIIEGRFDINGSIIVEENATLILRNAILNFTQVKSYQFSMTFQNPANGNPHFIVENATISSSNYALQISCRESLISLNNLTTPQGVFIFPMSSNVSMLDSHIAHMNAGDSTVNMSNSSIREFQAYASSNVDMFNCTILSRLRAQENSRVDILNSTISVGADVVQYIYSTSCSITDLQPGFVNYWNLMTNHSIAFCGLVANLTLRNTLVDGWSFNLNELSNVTITNCKIRCTWVEDSSVLSVYDSSFEFCGSFDNSKTIAYDSFASGAFRAFQNARIWLINSTSTEVEALGESEVYVYWYLDVHVVDSIGQDVPSANVTATYPNATVADWRLTDASGWTRLTLMEKMINATGEYPVGNYTIEVTYETHSEHTAVNMTGNKQVTIPEFPSFLIVSLFMIATLLAVIAYKRKTFSH